MCGLLERFFQQDITDSDWNRLNEIVDLQSSKPKSDVELHYFEDFWKPQHCQKCKYKPVKAKQRRPPQDKSFRNDCFSQINQLIFCILFFIVIFVLALIPFEFCLLIPSSFQFCILSFFHSICWIVYLTMIWNIGFLIVNLLLFAKNALTFLTYVVRNKMDHLTKCRMPSDWEIRLSKLFVFCLILFDYSNFPLRYNDLFGLC